MVLTRSQRRLSDESVAAPTRRALGTRSAARDNIAAVAPVSAPAKKCFVPNQYRVLNDTSSKSVPAVVADTAQQPTCTALVVSSVAAPPASRLRKRRCSSPPPLPAPEPPPAPKPTTTSYPLALAGGDRPTKKQRFGSRNQDRLLAQQPLLCAPAADSCPALARRPPKKAFAGGGGGGAGAPKLLMPPPPPPKRGKAKGGRAASKPCTTLALRAPAPLRSRGAAPTAEEGGEAYDAVEELKRVGQQAPQWSAVPLPAGKAAAQQELMARLRRYLGTVGGSGTLVEGARLPAPSNAGSQ